MAAEPVVADPTRFDIEEQPLGAALNEFARQSDREILYSTDVVRDKDAQLVDGVYEPEDALELLLADTGLEYSVTANDTFLVSEEESTKPGKPRPTPSPLQMAQASAEPTRKETSDGRTRKSEQTDSNAQLLEEIVVIGSNIRGVTDSASPVLVFGRQQIEHAGYATTHDFIRNLPQNFAAGASDVQEGFPLTTNVRNSGGGNGINLRGLGNDATLVLLNGHRLAPASTGTFVDISVIPLSAIESVSVLSDGASAIYGADAVGGVVNFSMRDDYEGAETRVRYGDVSDGSSEEIQLGQVVGAKWDSGSLLLAYEYYSRNPLDSSERSFTRDIVGKTTLVAGQDRNSLFVTANQDLTSRVEFYADAMYSNRETDTVAVLGCCGFVFVDANKVGETEQYGVTLASKIDLSRDWLIDITGAYSFNETAAESFVASTGVPTGGDALTEAKVWSLDAKADGTLFSVSGVDVKAAIGIHYRGEDLNDVESFEERGIDGRLDRNIGAAYGELFVPFFGSDTRRSGFERLELTLAMRYENYSDFGSSSDPKVGLLWSPVNGLNFRGTWGTSFRAPLLTELSEDNVTSGLNNVPNAAGATSVVLAVSGNNADLGPETATTWTAGVDIRPPSISSLNVALTYFDIEYKDRITGSFPLLTILTDPQFAPLLITDPDQALIDFYTSADNFFNNTLLPFPGFGPPRDSTDTEVFADLRLRNNSLSNTTGLDIQIDYLLESRFGDWGFGLNASYLFNTINQVTIASPEVDTVGQIYNPPDSRLRGSVSWNRGGFFTGAYVNYTSSFEGNDFAPDPVDSWTTVDLNLRYESARSDSGLLGDITYSLNVQNLFNEDPPFVFGQGFGFNYDLTNASPVGRFISINLLKTW